MKKAINTTNAPSAIGTYAQAIQSGNTLYLSGQIALAPETMALHTGNTEAQRQQIFDNLEAVLKAAGGSLDNILKLTVYLTSLKDFDTVNTVMQQRFQQPYPERAAIEVSALPKNATVEMDAIAEIE